MKDYYILVNGKRTGPFSIYELKEKNIYRKTQVWDIEQEDWYNAENFPELRHILKVHGYGDEYISSDTESELEDDSQTDDKNYTQKKDSKEEIPIPLGPGEKGFYLLKNSKKTGPYSVYQLKNIGIYYDSDIWSDDEDNWVRAEDIQELRHIIRETPPGYVSDSISTVNTYFGYTLASLGQRFMGDFITAFIQVLIYMIIASPAYIYLYSKTSSPNSDPEESVFVFMVLFLILALVGLAVSLGFRALFYPRYCGTFGHKVMGIKVISAENGSDYNKLTKGLIREALKYLLGQFIIPDIWLLWDRDRQNLYDKITKTYVVRKKDL